MKIIKQNALEFRYAMSTGQYKKVLLSFHHGLGDAISFFYNVLPVLKRKYPSVDFCFDTHMGQENIFGYVDKERLHYDLVVDVVFPCSEWDADSTETKAERSLRTEFGIEREKQKDRYMHDYYPYTPYPSPLVGVHFQSTSGDCLCYNKNDSEKLWNAIKERNLIPIDTQFFHPDATIKREPYSFADRNMKGMKPDVKNLFGLLGTLRGFAGVASGNFWSALCVLPPSKILYLGTEFPVNKLTRLPVHNMIKYDEKVVSEWLDDVENIK